MEVKQILALDVGQARTGIARASNIARLAEPLMTVETAKVLDTIKDLTREQALEAIVVGLPRNMKSDDTAQTDWVRNWVKTAKDQVNAPFYWQDEALTSKLAGGSALKLKKGQTEDALAAAIILEDFLDSGEAERVTC
ncbi:MAG: Holliday junction resolvase RuvX [Candidatus Saccharimonadales bacterium]